MKTVDETIASWTEEEKKKLSDLIKECRKREEKIRKSSESSQASLKDIANKLGIILIRVLGFSSPSKYTN